VNIEFAGELWYWRGPAPFHFISVPIKDVVRTAEGLALGDIATVELTVRT
jgi:hypothetical protein